MKQKTDDSKVQAQSKKASKKRVYNHIRTLRFHANEMTQQELANRVGVTRQTIVAIEKAKYPPSLELAFQIAEVFGMGIAEVFYYQSPESSEEVQKHAVPKAE